MATTYYYSSLPPVGQTSTVVTTIPGDYYVSAYNGRISLVASRNVRISGGTVDIVGADDVNVISTSSNVYTKSSVANIYNDAFINLELKAGALVKIDAPLTTVSGNAELGNDFDTDLTKFKSKIDSNFVPSLTNSYTIGSTSTVWRKGFFGEGEFVNGNNVQNQYLQFGAAGRPYDPTDIYDTEVNRRTGAVYVSGGVGIEKDLNVGGRIYGRIEYANTSAQIQVTATNIDVLFYPVFAVTQGNQFLYIDTTGVDKGLTYNPFLGKLTTELLKVESADDATPDAGAVRIDGGLSVGKTIYAAGIIPPADAVEGSATKYTIGTTSSHWAESYVETLYSKVLASSSGTVEIRPAANRTDIFGDIRVRGGTNPTGTAPVVSNILYVTMDGNDTNDGRAMDPSRACRTIGAALNSPYYQSGTQIRVAPGHYFEDNPLQLKPYTSIMGSDLRTCSIEPINKTQDLFHLNSGCYLAFMQFLNGRSGLLEGDYTRGFNRGAYATAFPPLPEGERIDLFHSPYIQNCTNLTGPWLKDGTMFVPSEIVQIPAAVGTGTWVANTTSIVVKASTGTIAIGMAVNAGQQNPGFFNARSLMLSNKAFIQEQVIGYVEATFNSGVTFSYNTTTCARDVGLILDSISMDLLYSSNSDSTFSGLQYWSQAGYTGDIAREVTATTNAIINLKSLVTSLSGVAGQTSIISTINSLFTTITNILSTSSNIVGISDKIVRNGLASTTASILTAYNAMLSNKASLQTQTLNYIASFYAGLVFNTSTCYSDVGKIVDSVAFDLLHGGNKQSIKSGVYYYNYSTTATQVPAQLPQTTGAFNYIKSIIPSIVTGQRLASVYQTATTQVIIGQRIASTYEAATLKANIDVITNIIRNGPSVVKNTSTIGLTINPADEATNAFTILAANKPFIIAEVIAFINATSNSFTYSKEYCYRDVGILVENISYDAAFGGNQKAVESGLAYYNGVISRIIGQESQTVAAIDYLNELSQKIITNTPIVTIYTPPISVARTPHSQVINTVLVGGSIATSSINNLFEIVNTIILNGPGAAPTLYTSPGPDAAYVSAETLMQANRRLIQEDTINYINSIVKQFPYNKVSCQRDVSIIIDSISLDLLYPTATRSQSTFAGLQYYTQNSYTGNISGQIGPTIDAVKYLKALSVKIIQNITPTVDLVTRYQSTVTQVTTLEPAGTTEAALISTNFDIILSILSGNKTGWSDKILPTGPTTVLAAKLNAFNLLIANTPYMTAEVIAYLNAIHPNISYTTATCQRDISFITDSIAFDLTHGGNKQSIQSGLKYYAFSASSSTVQGQETQTIDAFNRIKTLVSPIMLGIPVIPSTGTTVVQVLSVSTATTTDVNQVVGSLNTITNIIQIGISSASTLTSIALVASTSTSALNGYNLLQANREFIVDDVIKYLDNKYNPTSFNYNEAKCFRDVGLIVDAVSQDILLGGNYKSIEAGESYWSAGYNAIANQISTTTLAINYARNIALQIIANTPVTLQTQTNSVQIINPFFQYGGDYMPQQAVTRSFGIITNIIEKGPLYSPPKYYGGGIFALVGINGADVKAPPRVTSVINISTGTYRVGLSMATVGFGNNATLYFGDTLVFPKQDKEVEALSLLYTGNANTWNQRKVDPIGAMGGSLVDGGVISDISPIQSFVYDAFTQLNQGGIGVYVTNNGYAQLVSVFTIFCSIGVQTDNGGIASITNSNCNFGDISLLSSGYGPRKFSGTVYNPSYKAYPDSQEFNQYYPTGYWPNNARVRIYVPELEDRPHISLIMEVIPPAAYINYLGESSSYVNDQGFPGFLNATVNLGILTTGTIKITGIDTTDIAIGNALYIRDQNASLTNAAGVRYAATGTIVTNVGYQSVTLDIALTAGGFDPDNLVNNSINTNYFNLYFCGNAYYTVLSSEVGDNPKPAGVNILSTASTGGAISQVPAHIAAIKYLNSLTNQVISNTRVTYLQTATSQTITPLVVGGSLASSFINLRFAEIIDIIDAPNLPAAENTIPQSLRSKTGPTVQGASGAITLITANFDFLADEVAKYVDLNNTSTVFTYDKELCRRDARYIIGAVEYDIALGTNYNSVTAGNSYLRGTASANTVLNTEYVQTNFAINYLKIKSAEVLSSTTASILVSASNLSFTEILNILDGNNPSTLVFNDVTAVSANTIKAKNILIANKIYIQTEIIAWITVTYPALVYRSDKCFRDVGNIIDGLCYDILYGANTASRKVAESYIELGTPVIPTLQKADTLAAYVRLKDVVLKVVQGQTVTSSSGNSLTQFTTNPATATEGTRASELVEYTRSVIDAESISALPLFPSSSNPLITQPSIPAGNAITALTALISATEGIVANMILAIDDEFSGTFTYDKEKCKRDVRLMLQRLIYDIQSGGRYNSVLIGLSYWSRNGAHHIVQLGEGVTRTDLFPDSSVVNFYQRSYISASGYLFEYVGAGTNYGALPQRGVADPVQSKEVVQLNSGKVFFTSTDQNGDFRIGQGLVISQATGVLSGRTFTQSLFANMTPFILAIEFGQ